MDKELALLLLLILFDSRHIWKLPRRVSTQSLFIAHRRVLDTGYLDETPGHRKLRRRSPAYEFVDLGSGCLVEFPRTTNDAVVRDLGDCKLLRNCSREPACDYLSDFEFHHLRSDARLAYGQNKFFDAPIM